MKLVNISIVILYSFVTILNAQPGFDDNVDDVAPLPALGGFVAVLITLVIAKILPEKNSND